jgi:hypothetical protein
MSALPASSIDITPYADYHMISIHDRDVPVQEWPHDPWDRSALTGLLAAPRMLQPTIWSRWGFLPVRLEHLRSEPDLIADSSHVVETPLIVENGAVCVAGWSSPDDAVSPTDARSVVVRVSWHGLPDSGWAAADQEVTQAERLVIQFWPGTIIGVRVVRQSALWSNESLRVLFDPIAE